MKTGGAPAPGAGRKVLIRADASRFIGSGHVMRCSAIASEVVRLGGEALFAASDEDSADFVRSLGFPVATLPGDARSLRRDDAMRLAELAEEAGAGCVLVDTYAATDAFFDGLEAFRRRGGRTAYLDDLFTFEGGYREEPRRRPVDVVVNYSFSASRGAYERAYGGSPAARLVGPSFAPVRRQFRCGRRACGLEVGRILVTVGSTNQGRLLEGLVDACLQAVPRAGLSVVVGKLASYDGPQGGRVDVFRDVRDMASLMARADLALSAAGSTLYELAVMGVPTVAVAATENQSLNAEGFTKMGLGPVVRYETGRFVRSELETIVSTLADDSGARAEMASRALSVVDGGGAERIARALGC